MYLIIMVLIICGVGFTLYNMKIKKFKNEDSTKEVLSLIDKFINELEVVRNSYFTYSMRVNIESKYREAFKLATTKGFKKIRTENINKFRELYPVLEDKRKEWNKEYIDKELVESKDLLSNIDGKSLDNQQRMAVVTDEDSNLVIAGAGSGKTLTISAKVKYLVDRKGVNPEDILLISFTAKSAEEMFERISKKLDINVDVKTFHKLGLNIISKGREYRPDVAEEYLMGSAIDSYFKEKIKHNADAMRAVIMFLTYYLSVPKDLEKYNDLGEYYDETKNLDLETIKSKMEKVEFDNKINDLKLDHKTINGERVKSLEEVMIANCLYLNGIEYVYEYKYPFESDDKYKKQYRPDFYLPEYDLYIEHFGITKDYRTPWLTEIEERKYIDGIKWKREQHKKNGTTLIETYSYYNKEGKLLEKLEEKLREMDIEFKQVAFEEIYNKVYGQNQDEYLIEFKKLISTFIGLFKSNGYKNDNFSELYKMANKMNSSFLCERTRLFLDIVTPIYNEYQNTLAQEKEIDFNDMINEATEIIKGGKITLKYKYIIIDEYQDISMSRFNLINAIRNKTGAKLMCVGDDWQSIYRFAGSDINLFTKFGEYVGYYELLMIEKTYRNSQELIDIAAKFVVKNPNQIKKDLKSDKHNSKPIRILGYETSKAQEQIDKAIEEIVDINGDEAEIMIVSRNNKDIINLYGLNSSGILSLKQKGKAVILACTKYPKLKISLFTAHRSKGLEADNIIVINLENKTTGFPNKISNDSILSLVLTPGGGYEYDEERRLFYVAITRTKNTTYLVTDIRNKSIFIEELMKEQGIELEVENRQETILDNPKCPICQSGLMVIRKGSSNKEFLGCTNYPRCESTINSIEIINNQVKCSACGGYMVKRKGRYGEFYGCTNYPICSNKYSVRNDY